ncbi:thioesterase family protein [uncultured Lacinutrix sp.]|uniref:acyl-CoA thioesterase n=1 Tax=uncultured Lacinutrix sp. TaxID=574032 RepID=UPI0026240060|nr:thioesterase family protein [uncultured Lacinutrix sp.]
MQIFTKTITVTKEDLDDLNHVNNVHYVQWVNDIAKAHWEQNASTVILEDYFWVLISHTITYKASALLNDTILIKTYVTKASGVTSTRIVEIYNKDTEILLAKSETNWCFMSTSTKKPTRIIDTVINLFN